MKSKLNVENSVKGVNNWESSLLRYSAAFISWKICELQAIDKKIRMLFIIYGRLHPKSDVERLHIPRKDLIAIEDCIEIAVRGLKVYVHGREERLKQADMRDRVDGLEAASVSKKVKKGKRLQDWEEKVLHGQYLRQTKAVRSKKS